jgi:DNA-directed RNA polymerase specialized sigma24 family protein
MPARKPRSARKASGAPSPSRSRLRIAAALQRCTSEERAVLALLLFERLTPPEAADALGVPEKRVERIYSSLIRDLLGAASDGPLRRSNRRRSGTSAAPRKAA